MGDVTPADSSDVDPEFSSLLDNCSVDPSTDAAIPMRTIVENTSDAEFIPGITMVLKGLNVTWPSGNPGPLLETQISTVLDGSGTCRDVSQVGENRVDVNGGTPITKSTPYKQDWLWIVKGYYDAQYTEGQPAKLSSIALIYTPWVKGSGEGRESHLPMRQSCFSGERSRTELWYETPEPEKGFLPYISLGNPKGSKSLLTKARLKDGIPADQTQLDAIDYYACA